MNNINEIEELVDNIDVNIGIPEGDKERQYYFMKKCREYIKQTRNT